MRREELYLRDMVEAATAAAGFLADISREQFAGNDLVRSAVLQKMIVIGEAAGRMPKSVREAHPEIPWRDVASFRNIAVHAYFGIQWDIVWVAATQDALLLKTQVETILKAEYPEVLPGG